MLTACHLPPSRSLPLGAGPPPTHPPDSPVTAARVPAPGNMRPGSHPRPVHTDTVSGLKATRVTTGMLHHPTPAFSSLAQHKTWPGLSQVGDREQGPLSSRREGELPVSTVSWEEGDVRGCLEASGTDPTGKSGPASGWADGGHSQECRAQPYTCPALLAQQRRRKRLPCIGPLSWKDPRRCWSEV